MFPVTNLGRALLIPWSFLGILILGLVVFSIFHSVSDIGEQNVMRHHYEKSRERTVGRTVTTSLELERREIEMELARERHHAKHHAHRGSARSPATWNMQNRRSMFQLLQESSKSSSSSRAPSIMSGSSSGGGMLTRTLSFTTIHRKKQRVQLLREEKERFEAMRKIQLKTEEWKRWLRLGVTLSFFSIFWCVGAVVFWQTEQATLGE
jgi:potassium channel subfamily K, other eukaryote